MHNRRTGTKLYMKIILIYIYSGEYLTIYLINKKRIARQVDASPKTRAKALKESERTTLLESLSTRRSRRASYMSSLLFDSARAIIALTRCAATRPSSAKIHLNEPDVALYY